MADPSLEFSRGDVIAKKYEIIDLLDETPLGPTYRVRQIDSGKFLRMYALTPKMCEDPATLRAAFEKSRRMQHDNLLALQELGQHGSIWYATAEDFEGGTLRELLQEFKVEGTRLQLREAAQITGQLLDALAAAHDLGVVLRALRPEYVLVSVKRIGPRQQNLVARCKIIGGALWELLPASHLAEDEFARGEAQYIAPELKSFDPKPSPRSDVYSAGVILYEMLTGTAPVGTFQLPTQLRPDLPSEVNNLVELALGTAPDDRYLTARDFASDVQRVVLDSGSGRDDKQARSLLAPLVVGIGLLLVALIAVILFFINQRDPVAESQAADAQLRADLTTRHPKPSEAEVKAILAQHPTNMVYVPPGPFVEGRMNFDNDAAVTEPVTKIVEMKGFLIDAFEYPNLRGDQPTFALSFDDAQRACGDLGKRLCTALEWEKACKGPLNSVYGYYTERFAADTYDPAFCGEGLDEVGYGSGSRPDCKSGWGVFDMSGNFREWTSTTFEGKESRRIVKGGLRTNPRKGTRCAYGKDEPVSVVDKSISFRCCRDVDAPPVAPPAP